MAKVYLSPAMHKWNPCAIAGMDETTENNMYIDELIPFLDACGIQWKRGVRRTPKSNENGDKIMWQNIKESNAWGADIHYISHTNAANEQVKGYQPIIYPKNNAKGEKLAAILVAKRNEIYPFGSQLNRRSDLAELSETKATAYYEEHVFHDNLEDDTWFHNNMRSIARQTAKGFCEYFGIAFRDPYEGSEVEPVPQPEPVLSPTPSKIDVTYQTWDDVKNCWLPNVKNTDDYAGIFGHDVCAVYANLSQGNISYAVHYKSGKWLPFVTNRSDYAGLYNKPIDGLMIKTDTGKTVKYRVHLRRRKVWLPWVTGCNAKDSNNGYAGIIGQEIDGIQIEIQ